MVHRLIGRKTVPPRPNYLAFLPFDFGFLEGAAEDCVAAGSLLVERDPDLDLVTGPSRKLRLSSASFDAAIAEGPARRPGGGWTVMPVTRDGDDRSDP